MAPVPPEALGPERDEALARWIEATADWLGAEAEPVQVSAGDLERFLRAGGSKLFRLPGDDGPRFLALLNGGSRSISVLAPDLSRPRLSVEALSATLREIVGAPVAAEVEHVLDGARVRGRRRASAQAAILRERLREVPLGGCWVLRLPPGTAIWRTVREARLLRPLLTFAGAHATENVLWLLAWWMIGLAALQGRLDQGWLLAWALLLLTLVPFRLLATWSQGLLAVAAGTLLKQRLLAGALRLGPEEVRHQGVGQLLGRVIESEAVESLALSGGLLALVAGIELVLAGAVVAAGASGVLQTLLLISWVTVAILIGWRYFRHRRRWTDVRLELTHDLVERMVGHRTRLAQEARTRWHDGEDQAVEGYLTVSRRMDGTTAMLLAAMPRGWLLLGVAGLAPAFASGGASAAGLAVGLGGTLLAYRALVKLATGLSHLAAALIAWREVAGLFGAAARPEVVGLPAYATPRPAVGTSVPDGMPMLTAHDLVFRYPDRPEPVLRDCNLRVETGDRLLLVGPSGGGKSTLASLLIGLRVPDSGLLLLDGLDRQTLGTAGWRQRVVAAPQFHENHVLTETFAFNLLMGRRWPPRAQDVEEAETLCRELGLGDLLQRMPAGLLQIVGETGWQLSHGERSRLYIARALLQGAGLIILDESFAELDPETLRRCLHCVARRAPTLLVIAHP